MAESHRHMRSPSARDVIPEKSLLGDQISDHSLTDAQQARIQLRQRWELASVLNFICVFRPLIPKDLKVSAEEIETALITDNEDLGRIHIALLKGIPPINKSMSEPDAWITSVCKKLSTWWSWVAEGDNPLMADHGREILSYKQLEPTTRLLILKALCEVRAEQDDILQFIADELKKGTKVGSFRKERLAVGDSGVTYWYEGDPVIGHRLYREIGRTLSKQKAKGKDHVVHPTFESQWETIATNFEEFRGIVDSLSSSKVPGEAFVGEITRTDILPVLENHEKNKERALKRKERLTLELEGFLNSKVGPTRSCRERRPVIYTFDEYDRSIDEAIRISTEPNNVDPRQANGKQYKNGLSKDHPSTNGNMDTLNENSGTDDDTKSSEVKNDVKNWDNLSNHDDEDDDYDSCDDDYDDEAADDGDDTADSDSEKEQNDANSKPAHEKNHSSRKPVAGLRRSSRNADVSNQINFDAYHAVTKKRLRQRPTKNAGYIEAISDSEDENPAKSVKQTAVDSSSTNYSSTSAASSDESQEES